MLLEFKTTNYKSFKDELVFSMRPAPKQKGLDYSILQHKIGSKTYKALCSAVFYGPNASGKTNIIGAMDTFKSIVMRGNIRNSTETNSPNMAAYNLELIPNNSTTERSPVAFSISFIEDDVFVEYAFAADLGNFMEKDYTRKIVFEQLKINNNIIFTRDNILQFDSLSSIQNYLINEFENNKDSAITLATSNIDAEELFLANGFKTMFSTQLVSLITDWFDKKFMVIYRADIMRVTRKVNNPKKDSLYVNEALNDAVTAFGVSSNKIGFVLDDNKSEMQLLSVFIDKTQKRNNIISSLPVEVFESYGTFRFTNIFPLVMDAIQNGGILIVDEFDASIHPMALMSIINIFHNEDINIKKAQLVFNTHNPIFLNSNLFRRDEIKFIERDDETGQSVHYSLSDFKTSGSNGVRKNEDYMKNYFISQYGAIKDIDFLPIFEKLFDEQKEK